MSKKIMKENTNPPLVSIGMPVFNGEKSLRGALDSLLNQTYSNFELIFSDNGSTDDTKDIIQEYASGDKRIKLTFQKNNIGVINNFQFVLNEAVGEYFMWAAHDDRWASNYISDCLSVFFENHDCVTAFSHFNVIDLNTKEIVERIVPISCFSNSQLIRVFTRIHAMYPSIIYGLHKTEIIRKVNFEKFDWADAFSIIKLAYYGKIFIIPKCLYSAGINGPRVPYSITGGYISLNIFRHNIIKFTNNKFPFYYRIPLLLYTYYVSFMGERNLNKTMIKQNS